MNRLWQAREALHHYRRRMRLWLNRLHLGYSVQRRGWRFQVIVPVGRRSAVLYLKYLFTVIGLVSAFIFFQTVWHAFGFGLLVYLVSMVLEKTVFAHAAFFIHALPTFEIDPDKWFGVGFGYARPPDGSPDIPMVGMMVADVEYARKLEGLFLTWTGGGRRDEARNLRISVVVTGPTEYIFLCYPNPNRPAARRVFDRTRRGLRQSSLEDVLLEFHGMVVLGKRCRIMAGSYFPEFRRRYRSGVPVWFGFLLPPFDEAQWTSDPAPFIVFDFSIKDKASLTRRDFEYDAVGAFEVGGRWQGPPGQEE